MRVSPHRRCLVDVPGAKLPADLPAYLRTTVAPEVPESLREAFLAALDDSEQIRTMQVSSILCCAVCLLRILGCS